MIAIPIGKTATTFDAHLSMLSFYVDLIRVFLVNELGDFPAGVFSGILSGEPWTRRECGVPDAEQGYSRFISM